MVKVLVVEDDDNIRMSIMDILELARHDVLDAPDGNIGLQLALQEQPDLIISDVMMPNMDGHALFEALQKHAETASIPFIFLTALADKDDIRTGMNLGADDYLTKPFDYSKLINAVDARLQKQAILRERERKLRQELEIASNIQKSIQPIAAPDIARIDMGFHWQSAQAVGGDAWGWVVTSPTELSYFVLDIAGKGLPAALAAMSLHTALKLGLRMGLSPVDLIKTVNDEFYESFTRNGLFATVVVISIDTEKQVFTQANAGHTPTLFRRDGQAWQQLQATVPPVGVLPDISPESQMLELQAADCIICYSDGFSEIETPEGLWGDDGMTGAIPDEETNAQQIVNTIKASADSVRITPQLHDDQTLVIVTYKA